MKPNVQFFWGGEGKTITRYDGETNALPDFITVGTRLRGMQSHSLPTDTLIISAAMEMS